MALRVGTVLLDLSALRTGVRFFGIGRYLRDLARGLDGSSAPRVVGASHLGWPEAPETTSPNEARARAEAMPLETPDRWRWRVRMRLGAAARRARADAVHSGHPGAIPLTVRCPWMVTCHDLIPLRLPEHYLGRGERITQRVRELVCYRAARHVIAVSQTTADDLVRMLGVPAGRITVVHSGVDLGRWSAEQGPQDRDTLLHLGVEERRYVLYVGADDWRKNFPSMLRALALWRRRAPEIALVWAGLHADHRLGAILRLAKELGVADALVRLDHVDDAALAALYRGALGLLFVSRVEGFGYPLVEAMASGCPAIVSAGTSLAEIAAGAAHEVEPDAIDAMAEAVLTLRDDADARRSLSERGRARAAHLSLARMAKETLEVYRRVLGEC
jgi:glycosyltransferase involved in cell wall biosynthesis